MRCEEEENDFERRAGLIYPAGVVEIQQLPGLELGNWAAGAKNGAEDGWVARDIQEMVQKLVLGGGRPKVNH